MGKLTLEELRKLRENSKQEIEKRENSDKLITILVGMGTCGIAAGARDTLNTLVQESEKMGLKGIIVKPTGCMGSCSVEPTVEVMMAGMPDTLYCKVDSKVAKKILEEHVVKKALVNDHVLDKPAADIMK